MLLACAAQAFRGELYPRLVLATGLVFIVRFFVSVVLVARCFSILAWDWCVPVRLALGFGVEDAVGSCR